MPLCQKLKKADYILFSISVPGRYPQISKCHFWAILGQCWAFLGHLGPFRVILGIFFVILGHFGPFWDTWGHIWAILGHFGSLTKINWSDVFFFAGI